MNIFSCCVFFLFLFIWFIFIYFFYFFVDLIKYVLWDINLKKVLVELWVSLVYLKNK